VHYPFPIHATEAYAPAERPLPVAERLAQEICTLPLFPSMSDDEVARIVQAVRDLDMEAS
jgi:dTDP-4-amino-4,6-dideoxygalactose transaminase